MSSLTNASCRPEPEKNLIQLGMEKVEALSEEFMERIR